MSTYDTSEYRRNRDLIGNEVMRRGLAGDKVMCVICQDRIYPGDPWSVEHKVAVRNGGSNHMSNLGPAHVRCNSAMRASKPLLRYRRPELF